MPKADLEALEKFVKPARVTGYIPDAEKTVDEQSLTGGVLRSALWGATGGLIGLQPPESVERFQTEHPILGIGAEIAGSLPAYGLAPTLLPVKALTELPLIGRAYRAVHAAENVAKAPVWTAGGRLALELAPFEATRVAAAGGAEALGVPGSEGALKRVAIQAPVEMALGGLLGGGVAAYKKLRPFKVQADIGEQLIQDIVPSYDFAEPAQSKLMRLLEIRAKLPDIDAATQSQLSSAVEDQIAKQTKAILNEGPPSVRVYNKDGSIAADKSTPFVGKMENSTRATRPTINELFTVGDTKLTSTRKLVEAARPGKEFLGEGDLTTLLSRSGFPAGWETNVKYPRYAQVNVGKHPAVLTELRKSGMQEVEEGLFLGKEVQGSYVMARRLPKRVGKQIEYIVWKTHDPAAFAPNASQATALLRAEAYRTANIIVNHPAARRSPAFQDVKALERAYPTVESLVGLPESKIAEVFKRALPRKMEHLRLELVRGVYGLGAQAKSVLAPALAQFSKYPRARRILNFAQDMALAGDARAQELYFGRSILSETKTGFGQLFRQPTRVGGIEPLVKAVADSRDSLLQFSAAIRSGMSLEEARAAGFSKPVLDLMKGLRNADTKIRGWHAATDEVTGETTLVPKENHYLMSRSWIGDNRVPIVQINNGRILGYASGKYPAEAIADADRLVKYLADNGVAARQGELFRSGFDVDLANAKSLGFDLAGTQLIKKANIEFYVPKRFKERTGALGYVGSVTPVTADDIHRIVYGNIIQSLRMMQNNALRQTMMEEMVKLSAENPEIAKQVADRVSQIYGMQTQTSHMLSRALDKTGLGAILGTDGAMKLARGLNRTLFNLTLTGLDLGFPALNLLSTVMQGAPELAFLRYATPRAIDGWYTPGIAATRATKFGFWELNPLRVTVDSLKKLRNWRADPEFAAVIEKGLREGDFSPKFIEEFAGQNIETITHFKEVVAGKESMLQFLLKLNEFPGARSEEMSRMLSFTMGWEAGRKMFGLDPNKAFYFARQFTRNTMYAYTTADRARLITGPVGMAFGLFKNWSMHNTAAMMKYANVGLLQNEWRPFLWMAAMNGTVGGLGAVPLFGLAEAFSRVFTDKSFAENLYSYAGFRDDLEGAGLDRETLNFLADGLWHGFPSLLGVTLQGRAAGPGADFMRDLTAISSMPYYERASYLYQALGDSLDVWSATGSLRAPIDDPKTRGKFMRALAPRTMYRAYQITEDRAIVSLRTGNKLISEISVPEAMAYTLGFEPIRVAKAYEMQESMWTDADKIKSTVQFYGEAWFRAEMAKDEGQKTALMLRMMAEGVNPGSVISSSRTRYRNAMQEPLERQLNLYQREIKRRAFGE